MLNVALSLVALAIAFFHPRVRLAAEPFEPGEDEGGVV